MSYERGLWRQLLRIGTALALFTALAPALATALAGCGPLTGIVGTSDPQNVILIVTDDQTLEDTRFMPNVQRLLAREGTTFKNAFVTDSLCCPARATILRGQYAHNHGVISNAPPRGGHERFIELGREDSTVAT